jgi:hypothetical protein
MEKKKTAMDDGSRTLKIVYAQAGAEPVEVIVECHERDVSCLVDSLGPDDPLEDFALRAAV